MDVAVQSLHLMAAAAWLGGLIFLGLAAPVARRAVPEPQRIEFFRLLGGRFLIVAGAAAVLLAATGIDRANDTLGSWSALTDTRAGRDILAKTILFATALGLAAVHSFVLGPRIRRLRRGLLDSPGDPGLESRLRRASASSGIVSVVMLAETIAIFVLAADLA